MNAISSSKNDFIFVRFDTKFSFFIVCSWTDEEFSLMFYLTVILPPYVQAVSFVSKNIHQM